MMILARIHAASCPHWSGEPGELVMETPLAKRVIGDYVLSCDYMIAIDSSYCS